MSRASNNHSPTQFFNEAMYTQKVKNSEDNPIHSPVDVNQNLNQGHESSTAGRQDFRIDAHPCKKELIESYLRPRVVSGDSSCKFIHDDDVYAVHPADLTQEYGAAVARDGHKVWYFFTAMRARGGYQMTRKVASGEGFWHPESPKDVDPNLGYSRYLTFMNKEGSGHVRSKWVMVELGLHGDGKDKVTLCQVFWSPHPPKKYKRKAAADTNDRRAG